MASLVDGSLIGLIAIVLAVLMTLVGLTNEILIQVVPIILSLLYPVWLESSKWQGTIGKHLMGLKVTDISGNRISFLRALGRNLAKFISALPVMIGFIMAGFTAKKQGLHDMIAGTLVMKEKPAKTGLVLLSIFGPSILFTIAMVMFASMIMGMLGFGVGSIYSVFLIGSAGGNLEKGNWAVILVIVFATVAILSIVFSHILHGKWANIVASIPVIVFAILASTIFSFRDIKSIGQDFIDKVFLSSFHKKEEAKKTAEEAKAIVEAYSKVPRDYARSSAEAALLMDYDESFLVYDEEYSSIIKISINKKYGRVDVYFVGKIHGKELNLSEYSTMSFDNKYYDKNGKTIFDNYKIVREPKEYLEYENINYFDSGPLVEKYQLYKK